MACDLAALLRRLPVHAIPAVKHLAGVDCRKEFLDATLEQTIRQDVKYRYRA